MLLLVFAVLYPLILFPGALFESPGIITTSTIGQATERFLLLPKVLVLFTVGLLGLLQVWRYLSRDWFVILICSHFIWVVFGVINARDDLTYGLLGPHVRFDGLVYHFGLTSLGLFTYVLLKQNPELGPRLVNALIAAGTIQAILAILQKVSLDPIGPLVHWAPLTGSMGSLSHPGYLAGLLLPLILLGIWSFELHITLWGRALILGSTLVMTLGLAFSGNQTSFFALIIALSGLLLLRFRWATVSIVVVVLICLLLGGRAISTKNTGALSENYSNTTTLKTRAMIWALSLQLFRDIPFSPLIGGGPDALKLSILRYLEPMQLMPLYQVELDWPENTVVSEAHFNREDGSPLRMSTLDIKFAKYGQEDNYTESFPLTLDRAHNFWLDRLLAYGLLGVFTWLAIYIWPVLIALKKLDQQWAGGLTIAMLALLLYYFFWFPVSQVEPLHIILVALLWSTISHTPTTKTAT